MPAWMQETHILTMRAPTKNLPLIQKDILQTQQNKNLLHPNVIRRERVTQMMASLEILKVKH
jgi:hypothetical protein